MLSMFKAKVAVMETRHEMVAIPVKPPIAAPTADVAAVAVAAPVPERPRVPVPVPDPTVDTEPLMSADLREQYVALSRELGINQPGLQKDAARAYFKARGTRLYDGPTVKAYLDDQYGVEVKRIDPKFDDITSWLPSDQPVYRTYPTWGWRPLRAQDVVGDRRNIRSPQANDSIWPFIDAYAKPLPLPVLLTAKEVVTAFPDARFYVSDEIHSYEHRDPVLDPFLLVVIEGERFIIERWDEPAYRE